MVEAFLERYREEFTGRVLPFWLRHAPDAISGGFHSCLDERGEVFDPRKYVWMVARAAWMFARIFREWEPRPEYRAAAETNIEFLRRHAREGEPRCWFRLTDEGVAEAYQRKPYAAFFVALAYTEWSRITGDRALLDEAEGLYALIVEGIRNPTQFGRPALPGGVGYTQLADLYVEAWLAAELDAVAPHPRYGMAVNAAMERLAAHFDPQLGLFRENAATGDAVAFARYPEGRLVCAGSSLEVSWLFLHLLRRYPRAGLAERLHGAILSALEFGWDTEYGGIHYFQDAEGRPPVALESNMKLWWPHTEAIYASALAYRQTGDERYLDWWRRVDEYAFRTFADSELGEWYGYCDRRGAVATRIKGGPYKGAFHVPRMLLFTLQAYS